MARSNPRDVFLRLSAALLGTLPVALYASLALATYLPVSDAVRAVIGFYAPLPLYALFACLVARAHAGARAWLVCVGAAALLKLGLVLL
jgi:hypothetical protein